MKKTEVPSILTDFLGEADVNVMQMSVELQTVIVTACRVDLSLGGVITEFLPRR